MIDVGRKEINVRVEPLHVVIMCQSCRLGLAEELLREKFKAEICQTEAELLGASWDTAGATWALLVSHWLGGKRLRSDWPRVSL